MNMPLLQAKVIFILSFQWMYNTLSIFSCFRRWWRRSKEEENPSSRKGKGCFVVWEEMQNKKYWNKSTSRKEDEEEKNKRNEFWQSKKRYVIQCYMFFVNNQSVNDFHRLHRVLEIFLLCSKNIKRIWEIYTR